MIINPKIKKDYVDTEKYNITVASFLGDVDANGVLLSPIVPADVVFTGVKGIAAFSATAGVLCRRFQNLSTIRTVNFPDLEDLTTSGALERCFDGCANLTSISFPALKTTSFGNTYINQLNNFVGNVTGCVVHFPSNLSTKVSSLTGYPNFGGINTTILFDLPATE